MSIVVRFTPAPGTTAEKYDDTQPLIEEAAGEWPPDGLEYHVAFSSGGDIRVSEIWDSKEQFEAFGATLMPILARTVSNSLAHLRCSRYTTSSSGKGLSTFAGREGCLNARHR